MKRLVRFFYYLGILNFLYRPTYGGFSGNDSENLAREISINSNDLKILIDNTKFCMGLDESRQYLNGIYFHGNEDKVLAVATDGTDYQNVLRPLRKVIT